MKAAVPSFRALFAGKAALNAAKSILIFFLPLTRSQKKSQSAHTHIQTYFT
jgi:hypothetical protein